jgi:exonuclease III
MNPRLISWNVRGLNQGGKRLKIINLLRQWRADIICLQETKLQLITNSIVRSLWGCQFLNWCDLPSSGASGGILLMWDRRVKEKIEVCVGEYVVACSFRNI